MKANEWRTALARGDYDAALGRLYGDAEPARRRYMDLAEGCGLAGEVYFISAPGRTELLGNHTDHQRGRVLAAALSMDILAAVSPLPGGRVRLVSPGFGETALELDDAGPRESERESSAALIRGAADYLRRRGYAVGGFEAVCVSAVPAGSGLSSSAAFETLIGSILGALYNCEAIDGETIALAGQYGENRYFGKPCGLMDQMACALGGAVAMDFRRPAAPAVTRMSCSFEARGYELIIVNAGGSHQGLTEEYAAVPREMGSVAAAMGASVLGDTSEGDFYASLGELRRRCTDRALLRAMHFYGEERRVPLAAEALARGDMGEYIRLMRESGESSLALLQNIYPGGDTGERSLSLALALCQRELEGHGGWRVHGGGFAGTVQALTPKDRTGSFIAAMETVFGPGCCCPVRIRPRGGCSLGPD